LGQWDFGILLTGSSLQVCRRNCALPFLQSGEKLENKRGRLAESPPPGYAVLPHALRGGEVVLLGAESQALGLDLVVTAKVFGDFFPAGFDVGQCFIDCDFACEIAGEFAVENN
jgi:hypothetical protein